MFSLFNISLTYVDIISFCIIIFSGVIGHHNGIIREILKLVLWLISIMLSLTFYAETKKLFTQITNIEIILKISAFLIPLILYYFLLSIFMRFYFLNSNIMNGMSGDKFFGFIFGIFKGLFIIVICFGGIIYLFNSKDNFPDIITKSLLFNPIKSFSIYIMEIFLSMF